ncbi:MAG: HlyD family efflux transporter periplasmic adaptor subunit [Bacteroidales bacterium]|nr:HlyD family efflux transporter periplasmic adaptor subunit [Bacteroidales bacterium]
MDRVIEKKNRLLSKRNIWIMVGGILAALVIYNIFFGDKSSKLNVEKEKITIETIEKDVFKDYIAVIGTVEPIKTIYLDAVEGGRVEDIMIEEGNMVEKGDEIIRLSNTDLMLQISNNEAQVARAINELRQARLQMQQQQLNNESELIDLQRELNKQRREYENNERLYKNEHISYEEYKQSKERHEATVKKFDLFKKAQKQDSIFRAIQIEGLEKSVDRLEKSVDVVRDKLENLNVQAPVHGELASLNPEEGQVINYGERIGKINILDDYKLNVEIDEHYISRVRNGLPGSFDYSGSNYDLKLVKKYPEVNQGKFTVDMVFTNHTPEDINIGQTFRIKLELGQSKTAVLIPRGGFYQSTGGQWVYVVDESGDFATKRNIRIGRQNPQYYEVIEGLQPGEKVIVSSYDNFNEVDKLMLKD